MDRSYYLNLNKQYHDARLDSLHKLNRIKEYHSLIEEYKKQNPNSNLSELELPIGNNDVKKFLSVHLDQYHDLKKKLVFIRGYNGKYVSGENGESRMKCDRGVPLDWEKFVIEDRGKGFVSLKSMGKYVSNEFGFASMACNRRKAGVIIGIFKMIDHGNGIHSFIGLNGKYFSVENGEKVICCGFRKQKSVKFHIRRIQSLADEIKIGWTLLNKHMNTLCDNCDAAESERAKVNPEDFYYMKSIEVRHFGRDEIYRTRHEERRFDRKEFKAAVKNADKKVIAPYVALNKHAEYILLLLNKENKKIQEIATMFNLCTPAIPRLRDFCEVNVTTGDSINGENDYESIY